MITARFLVNERGERPVFSGFAVRGHSEMDVPGRDIVCAAVSALTQAAVLGIDEVVRCPAMVEEGEGYLACNVWCPRRVEPEVLRGAQVILETTYLALKDISEQYPERVSLIKVGGE